jgi:glycosyltransferase involved in cell wall biosynthesis
MKVCFVTFAAGEGMFGAERWLVGLIEGLRRQGIACSVIVNSTSAELTRRLRAAGVPVEYVPFKLCIASPDKPQWHRVMRTGINLIQSLRVAWLARRMGADVIYSNSLCINAGALASIWSRLPHVWQVHEFGEEDHGWRYDVGKSGSRRMLDRLSDAVVMVSQAVADKFASDVAPHRSQVVYQAVEVDDDVADAAERPASRFRCVIAGRLSTGKGQEDAIRAVASLVRQGVDVDLDIVGDGSGSYATMIKALVEELGVTERIRFVGYQANPFPFMRAADAVLVCSTAEAFGRVTVEAFLAGRAVIGVRSGGTAELIEQGGGLMYTAGDSDGLAAQIRRLVDNRAEAKLLGERARNWATKRFTSERATAETMAILNRVTMPTRRLPRSIRRRKTVVEAQSA